jgi:hypothetical protein
MIAEKLKDPSLVVRQASQLELSISTFAPSSIIDGFKIADYPFIESRYLSIEDGHVYIVAGATEDGDKILAYRLWFWWSLLGVKGGIAVGVTPQAWVRSCMTLYSVNHATMHMLQGEVAKVEGESRTRRGYPMKKFKAYVEYHRRRWFKTKAQEEKA